MCRNEVNKVMFCPRGIWSQWPLMSKYEIWPLTGNKGQCASEMHRNVFYWSLGTFRSLNRGSVLVRSHFIGKNAIWSILDIWPDLRGHRLTQDLNFGYQRIDLVPRYTLVFFSRSSSFTRGQTAKGVQNGPPELAMGKSGPELARVKFWCTCDTPSHVGGGGRISEI